MNSRQRVLAALNHQTPDALPFDLGATPITGMHVSTVYALRQALGLDAPGTPVRVTNIFQMLGETKPDLLDALGVDVAGVERALNSFGIANQGWKEWTTFQGTPVIVPEGFNTRVEPNGDLLIYPQGDASAPASGRMPTGGYYFDVIIRQPPLDEANLNVEDNLVDYTVTSDADLEFYRRQVESLRASSDRAIIANPGVVGFGDVGQIPGPAIKHPKGIRDTAAWYMAHVTHPDYVEQIFEYQCSIALQNVQRFYEAVGDQLDVVLMGGTDFGGQKNLLFSPNVYRSLYKPYHKRLNDWVHEHTPWKTFIHTDGAIFKLIPDLIEAGFDILNPVQWTAAGMDLAEIKARFGEQLTFWGAGVDTQGTLPFGSPAGVRDEVHRIIDTVKPGGGFIFSSVHNIQAGVPIENLLAYFEAYREARCY